MSEVSFEFCEESLKNFYFPKNCVIAVRYKFYSRQQAENESLTQYISVLRRLSLECHFGEFLQQALRDHLILGTVNQQLLRKLLSQPDELTWDQTVRIVQEFETVE